MTEVNEVKDDPILVESIVPIPVAVLKRKFKENICFVIDYDNSKFKGNVFLTYLTNVDTPCQIKFSSTESKLELLKVYMESGMVVNSAELADMACNVLLAARGEYYVLDFDPEPFIDENEEIIKLWLERILSLVLYALYIHPATKDLVDQFPCDEDESTVGINFVNLIGHNLFHLFFCEFKDEELRWNRTFFTKYCFKGTNLLKYFEVKNNPLLLGILAMDQGKYEEVVKQGLTELEELTKGIEHVSSV